MSLYSKSELRQKGEEIVKEAANATLREAESHEDAYREQQAEDGHSTAGPGAQTRAITEEEKAQLKAWVEDELSWVPDSIYNMGDPDIDGDGFDSLISSVEEVAGKFGGTGSASGDPDLEFTAKAQAEIEEWQGVFAENFQNSFTIPFPTIQENQGKVGNMLYESAKAAKNVYVAKRRDVSEMCDKTIAALQACGERDGGDEKMGLVILGGVVAIASAALAVPSGGTSVYAGGIALSVISAGISVGAEAAPESQDLDLGAPTVNEVIGNMISRMSDINQGVSDQEQDVCKALDANYEVLTSVRSIANAEKSISPLTPMRPSIVTADDPTSGLNPE